MFRSVFSSAVLMLALLITAQAPASSWSFENVYTLDPVVDGTDGTIYNHGGPAAGPVKQDAFVQFIVATGGAAIVDPLEYFDSPAQGGNDSGGIDTAIEGNSAQAWLNSGADPAAISGGTNVLCSSSNVPSFTGEFALSAPGKMDYSAGEPLPLITSGLGQDFIAMRVWSLTKQEMEVGFYGGMVFQSLYYWTDREIGSGGGRDTGWSVGMGAIPLGADPTPSEWAFATTIGVEVHLGKPYNELDQYMGATVPYWPEPNALLLIAAGLPLLFLWKRRRSSTA